MATSAENPITGTSAATYEAKRAPPDDKVLEVCREAVPDMDEQANVVAADLNTAPAEAISRMLAMCGNVKHGLGFVVAVGNVKGVIPSLVALLGGHGR